MSWLGAAAGFVLFGPIGALIGHVISSPPYKTPSHSFEDDSHARRKFGDVLCARRTGFLHFGICSGDDSVIHYTDKKGKGISSSNEIVETDFKTFEQGDVTYVVSFPEEHSGTIVYRRTINLSASSQNGAVPRLIFDSEALKERMKEIKNYKLYTPEETVERARSKLGEKEYKLSKNNCEHFAIWCKTGVHESHQVEKLLGIFEFISVKCEEEEPVFEINSYSSIAPTVTQG